MKKKILLFTVLLAATLASGYALIDFGQIFHVNDTLHTSLGL